MPGFVQRMLFVFFEAVIDLFTQPLSHACSFKLSKYRQKFNSFKSQYRHKKHPHRCFCHLKFIMMLLGHVITEPDKIIYENN